MAQASAFIPDVNVGVFCRKMIKSYPSVCAAGFLLLCWSLQIALSNPRGEFPLIDDWSYAQSTWWTLESGRLRLHDFTSMPLVTQVVFGGVWTACFGKSFEALRSLNILVGFLGVVALYGLCREVGATQKTSIFAALVFGCNPLYLLLSCSFMTDVPFCALALFSVWAFVAGVCRKRTSLIVCAFMLAFAVTFVRQVGLALPMAFGFSMAMRSSLPLWKASRYFAPTALTALALWGYERLLALGPGVPYSYDLPTRRIASALKDGVANYSVTVIGHATEAAFLLGMFTLPLVIVMAFTRVIWQVKLLWATISVVVAYQCAVAGLQAPFNAESLFDLGVGVIAICNWQMAMTPTLPPLILLFVTALSIFATGIGVGFWVDAIKRHDRNPVSVMLAALVFISMAPLLVGEFRDRYLLFPLALLIIAAAPTLDLTPPRAIRTILGVVFLVVMAGFSIGGVHDLFAMNRVRWAILDDLTNAGISPTSIDGGYEFNGLKTYFRPDQLNGRAISLDKSPYWVVDDEWEVSLAPDPARGYVVLGAYNVGVWLSNDLSTLYLLRRTNEPVKQEAAGQNGSAPPPNLVPTNSDVR